MTDLHVAVDEYLALRRSFGFKLDRAGGLLHQFVDHLHERNATAITTQMALEWATLPRQATPWWWRRRLSVVRGFTRHLQASDPSVEVPPTSLISSQKPRAIPYIYSGADINALITAAGQLKSPLQRATYQTLIGLLAVTGMRVGEAIALDADDVELAEGLIVVRHGKFGKARQLVVHSTTIGALTAYREACQLHCPRPATPAFFVSTVGTRLFYPNVSALFRRLRRQAGLPSSTDGCRPRLHDFRHRFAVQWLVDWYAAGVDVGPRLPALTTYLGHAKPADTYWYLTATPELLRMAAERLEASAEARP